MADPKSLARVARLLDGSDRPDDLVNLFLYARDRCDGREAVQEIGDFVAHHDERSKGIVTRTTRDFFAITLFHAPSIVRNTPHKYYKLPEITPAYLRATARRFDNKETRKFCGMSKSRAYKLLPGLINQLIKNEDKTYSVAKLDGEQMKLFSGLVSKIAIRPAFTGDRLFEDFIATLKNNELLSNTKIAPLEIIRIKVQLFAIAFMHNSSIIMEDGSKISALAMAGQERLSINVAIPAGYTSNKTLVQLGADIFTTNIAVKESCSEELQSLRDWSKVYIEIALDGKLSSI